MSKKRVDPRRLPLGLGKLSTQRLFFNAELKGESLAGVIKSAGRFMRRWQSSSFRTGAFAIVPMEGKLFELRKDRVQTWLDR